MSSSFEHSTTRFPRISELPGVMQYYKIVGEPVMMTLFREHPTIISVVGRLAGQWARNGMREMEMPWIDHTSDKVRSDLIVFRSTYVTLMSRRVNAIALRGVLHRA